MWGNFFIQPAAWGNILPMHLRRKGREGHALLNAAGIHRAQKVRYVARRPYLGGKKMGVVRCNPHGFVLLIVLKV